MLLTYSKRVVARWNRFSSKTIVTGRATTVGTKYFLDISNIHLQHQLRSGLYVNPVSIGYPFTLRNGQEDMIDNIYYGAVMEDRCNCICVYSNNDDDGKWYSNSVEKLIESGLDREGIVTVANLGNVSDRDQVMQQLDDARRLTHQEYVDIIMLNIHPELKEGSFGDFNGINRLLEELCKDDVIHSYGFSMSLEPFNMHTPAPNRGAKNMFFPPQFEHDIKTTMPSCDFVAYPLSPTHATPHALSMLPTSPEHTPQEALMHDEYHDRHRKFARIAMNPLCCFRGHGPANPEDTEDFMKNEKSESKNSVSKSAALIQQNVQPNDISDPSIPFVNGVKEDDPVVFLMSKFLPPEVGDKFGEALDTLCPALKTTPKLEDKALRIVLSLAHEVVMVEPEIQSGLGKLSLSDKDIVGIDDVVHIFGGFMIPLEVDQALREGIEYDEKQMMTAGENGEVTEEMIQQWQDEFAHERKKK